ncbi:hypothetical protein ACWD4K_04400 [Streptomyces gelaticus]
MAGSSLDHAKQAVRTQVWDALTAADAVHDASVHDVSVDLIVTPDETIVCPNPHRPSGVDWSALTAEKIATIPALAARQGA